MKIAIFTKDIGSGAFLHVSANISQCFSILGIKKIDLIYLEGAHEGNAKFFPAHVRLVRLRSKRILFSIFPLLYYLLKNKPDLLISMPAYVNILSITAKILSLFFWRGKLIIAEHATISKEILEHKNKFFMGNIDKFARFFYKYADALIGVSQGCIADLKMTTGLTSPKMYCIPNSVNLKLIRSLSFEKQTHPIHPWLCTDRKIPCFITVGRLASQKNHAILLEAFKQVIKSIDARLIIIGDGYLRSHLETKANKLHINNVVDFVGYKNNPYPFIRQADCFVLSSSDETFGLVLVEAMALGTPVIAFDSAGSGPKEVLDNGQYGILVKNMSAESLGCAMIETITSPERLSYFTKQGILRAEAYLPEIISNRWRDILSEIGAPIHKSC